MLPKKQEALKLKSQNIRPNKESGTVEAAKSASMNVQTPKPSSQSPSFKRAVGMGPGSQSTKALRYDIPTLLSIGRQLATGQPLQTLKSDRSTSYGSRRSTGFGSSVLKERSMNHQRNSSMLSTSTDDGRGSVRHPRRQPINAPQGALAQLNAGFARFLKEHSSPKHHRVTAGGRIVPMNLQHPAPEFKLPKVAADTPNYAKTETFTGLSAQKQHPNPEANPGGGNKCPGKPSHVPGSKAIPIRAPPPDSERTRTTSISKRVEGQNHGQRIPSTNALKFSNQQTRIPPSFNAGQTFNVGPTSFDGVSILNTAGMHQENDQQRAISFNSQIYPSQTIGSHFLADNMQQPLQMSLAPQAGNSFGMYPFSSGLPASQAVPSQNGFGINPTFSYSAAPTMPGTGYDFGAKALFDSAIQEYDNISNQLSSLDRYLALHTWDIDPATKRVLVDQRIELVRRLDSARVYKENLENLLQSSRFETNGNGQISEQSFMVNPNYGAHFSIPGTFGMNNSHTVLPAGGYQQPGFGSAPGVSVTLNPFSGDALGTILAGRPIVPTVDGLNGGYEHLQAATEHGRIGVAALNWADGTDSAMNHYSTPRNATSRLNKNERQPGFGAFTAPSSELDMLYHKIEEAAKRKEPLEPYFKELARVTALMNAMGINDNPGEIVQSGKRQLASNCTGNTGRQPSAIGTPDPRVGKPRVSSGKAIKIATEQENSRPSNRGVLNEITAQKKAAADGEPRKASLNPLPEHQAKGCTCTRKRGNLGNVSDNSTQTNIQSAVLVGLNPGAHISLPTPSRQPEPGSDRFQTGVAPAIKNNPYGNFPRFDGAGDSSGQASKPTTPTTNVTSGTILTDAYTETTNSQRASRGFHEAREDPDPMEVRAFFQLVREEDREAVRKQVIDHPPF